VTAMVMITVIILSHNAVCCCWRYRILQDRKDFVHLLQATTAVHKAAFLVLPLSLQCFVSLYYMLHCAISLSMSAE